MSTEMEHKPRFFNYATIKHEPSSSVDNQSPEELNALKRELQKSEAELRQCKLKLAEARAGKSDLVLREQCMKRIEAETELIKEKTKSKQLERTFKQKLEEVEAELQKEKDKSKQLEVELLKEKTKSKHNNATTSTSTHQQQQPIARAPPTQKQQQQTPQPLPRLRGIQLTEEEKKKQWRIIYVRNLPFSFTEQDVRRNFSFEGFKITNIDMWNPFPEFPESNAGFAFIEYNAALAAREAIERFHGRWLGGRQIDVDFAYKKDDYEKAKAKKRLLQAQGPSHSGRAEAAAGGEVRGNAPGVAARSFGRNLNVHGFGTSASSKCGQSWGCHGGTALLGSARNSLHAQRQMGANKNRDPVSRAFDIVRELLQQNNNQPLPLEEVYARCAQRGIHAAIVNECVYKHWKHKLFVDGKKSTVQLI